MINSCFASKEQSTFNPIVTIFEGEDMEAEFFVLEQLICVSITAKLAISSYEKIYNNQDIDFQIRKQRAI